MPCRCAFRVGKHMTLSITRFMASLLMLWLVAGCSREPEPLRQAAEFENGQKVKSVLSGDTGMVIWRKCCYDTSHSGWRYGVRFAAPQLLTNTSIIGPDGPSQVLPLAVVDHMRAYELEASN